MTYLSCLLIDLGENPDRERPGRFWISNIYHVHQRLSMAFPSWNHKERDPKFLEPYDPNQFERPHFLFRIDKGAFPDKIKDRLIRAVILVQYSGDNPPDWNYAFHNAPGLLAAPVETKVIELNANMGDRFRFRLDANPTKKQPGWDKDDNRNRIPIKAKGGTRENRDRHPLYDRVAQIAWLQRKAEIAGFRILVDEHWKDEFREEERRKGARLKLFLQQHGRRGLKKAPGHKDDPKLTHFGVRYEGILEVTNPDKFAEARASGIGPAKAFGFGLLSVVPV